MKTNELSCYVIVRGVKARCRKTSRELIKIGRYPIGTTIESVKDAAIAKTKAAMKSIDNASIHLDVVEYETIDGITMESFLMYDSRHIKQALTF